MESCTVGNALVALRSALHGDTPLAEREHACSAQQHVSALVWGGEGAAAADLLEPPHPLRDELLRPSRGVFWGGGVEPRAGSFAPLCAGATGDDALEIVGAAVLRTPRVTVGVAVALEYVHAAEDAEAAAAAPTRVVLLAPAAPLAQLEQEFLSGDELAGFEKTWAHSQERTIVAAQAGIAAYARGVGDSRFPSKLFSGAHALSLAGPVPALSLCAPANAAEMRKAATALQLALLDSDGAAGPSLADSVDPLVRLVQRMIEQPTLEARVVGMRSEFSQHAAVHPRMQLQLTNVLEDHRDAIEDALFRPVVTYVAALLALRVDSDETLAEGNFEVRADAVVRALPTLESEGRRALAGKLASLSGEETRARQLLAPPAVKTVSNPYPSVGFDSLLSSLPRLGFAQTLVDAATRDELPGALAAFFERGYHSAELLRVKFKRSVDEYLMAVGSLLSSRHALACVKLDALGKAVALVKYSAWGVTSFHPRDLPRFALSSWCLVLVSQVQGNVGVLKLAGVQTEQLVFSAQARDELAAVAPDLAPLAERLLLELQATQQRLDAVLAAQAAPPTAHCAAANVEAPAVKKLRSALEHVRQQMVA
jgi:hypothetical protein